MPKIRRATPVDSATIAKHRSRMFQDNALSCEVSWQELERTSTHWLESHLRDESYVGSLVEEGGKIVAGAGVWFMEWPPHYLDVGPIRGYLMNFYVAPEARGQRLATGLLHLAEAECRRRGIRVAVLHASTMGRPIYEGAGWRQDNEMMLLLDEERSRTH